MTNMGKSNKGYFFYWWGLALNFSIRSGGDVHRKLGFSTGPS
jgi:hypothetical protein